MSNIDRKLFRLGAVLVGPALLVACQSTNTEQTTPTEQTPTKIGKTLTTREPNLQPTNAVTARVLPTRIPTIAAPEPENTRNSILIHRGDYEYKLYTDVTLDEIISTANSLPQTNTKPQIIEKLQTLSKVLGNNPENTVYLFLLEQVLGMNNDNCKGGKSIELTKEVASWVKQKYPERYDVGRALFEQGPCSVIKEVRAIDPSGSQAVNPIIGLDGQPVFNEKGYRYSMYSQMTLGRLLGEPGAQPIGWDILLFMKENGYINPQSADDIRRLLTSAKQKELANPQDSATIDDVNSAANILNTHCYDHDKNGLYPKGYMNGLASYTYHKNPQAWPTNERIYIGGNCFWGEKLTTTP